MTGITYTKVRRMALGAVVGLLGAGAVAAAPAAFGQDASPQRDLSIRVVDATAYPTVKAIVTTPGATALDVTQDGQPVTDLRSAGLDEAGVSHLTVFALDLSKSMDVDDAIDHVALGLKQVVLGKSPAEQVALVTFGVSSRTTVNPTTDGAQVIAALDNVRLSAREDASRNDGVREAVAVVEQAHVDVADIVLVTASHDGTSAASESTAIGGVAGAGVAVHAVGIDTGELDSGALHRLVGATPGGSYVQAADAAAIVPALQATRTSLDATAVLTYTGPAAADVLHLQVQADGASASAVVNAGHRSMGDALRPGSADGQLGKGPAFLRDASAKFLVLGIAALAFVLLAYGVFLLLVREDTDLQSVLSHYDDRPVSVDDDEDEGSVVQSKLLRRAVALTSKVAEQQGLLTKVEGMLERAELPLRSGEALFLYLMVVVVAGVLGLVVTGSLLLAVILLAVAALVPPAFVNMKAAKRRAAFQAQLPDMLNLLAGSLRAGYSLMQGVEAVSREVQDPMGAELRRVVVESRLGRPLDEALEDASKRMASPDFAWTVLAIRIQREVGGNLAELLLTVADTMVQRERLRRDVKSLTAEGRVSAVVLAILPPGLMGAMYVVNPDYIRVLFTDPKGNFLLGITLGLALVGFAWMKKLGNVEV